VKRDQVRRFEVLEREVCVGPSSVLDWILREYQLLARRHYED
jgi:hypothetical protein